MKRALLVSTGTVAGLAAGIASMGLTFAVYKAEDAFKRLLAASEAAAGIFVVVSNMGNLLAL